MTNKEAIQMLSTRDKYGVPCGYTSGYQEALDMAIDALNQTAWIPAGERLPDADEPVLVSLIYQDKKFVSIDWVSDAGVWQEYRRSSVTAWMPLPEPYKGDGESE